VLLVTLGGKKERSRKKKKATEKGAKQKRKKEKKFHNIEADRHFKGRWGNGNKGIANDGGKKHQRRSGRDQNQAQPNHLTG